VDCFAGSGTTLAVARKTGRRAIGIEKRESQCQRIVERLSQGELLAL
jgi:site-specific DNA-methyltransferase (adenine-specific)